MLLALALSLSFHIMAAGDSTLTQSTRLFDRIWKEFFAARGETYQPPRLVAFAGKGESSCGKMSPGNAYYCEKDNSVYYDEEFLAALRLRVASETGSTGEAAPIIAIAHELGHAVYAQMNRQTRPRGTFHQLQGYGEEKIADCLAGALTRAASEQGILTQATLAEAEVTMAIIGQLKPQKGHPTWRVRHDTFLNGFRGGVNACSATTFEKLKHRAPSARPN